MSKFNSKVEKYFKQQGNINKSFIKKNVQKVNVTQGIQITLHTKVDNMLQMPRNIPTNIKILCWRLQRLLTIETSHSPQVF